MQIVKANRRTYNVAFAFLDGVLLHGLEGVLRRVIGLARAEVDFGEVAATYQFANVQLFFEVNQNSRRLKSFDPLISSPLLKRIKLMHLALRHEHKPIQVSPVDIFDAVPFYAAVFHVQDFDDFGFVFFLQAVSR